MNNNNNAELYTDAVKFIKANLDNSATYFWNSPDGSAVFVTVSIDGTTKMRLEMERKATEHHTLFVLRENDDNLVLVYNEHEIELGLFDLLRLYGVRDNAAKKLAHAQQELDDYQAARTKKEQDVRAVIDALRHPRVRDVISMVIDKN